MYAIESNIKPPKVRKERKCPANVEAAYKAYSEAYRAVFGVSPTGFTYDKELKFIKVGASGGVSLRRLKEMTTQLRNRAGM